MEIRTLCVHDYDALLSLLNQSFATVRNRPVDFLRGQPKMWVRDDAHMEKHLGLFEDGRLVAVVGIYPLDLRVGDTVLRFATTGNVATLPEYAGRGYFSKLFSLAMEQAEKDGSDALRLGLRMLVVDPDEHLASLGGTFGQNLEREVDAHSEAVLCRPHLRSGNDRLVCAGGDCVAGSRVDLRRIEVQLCHCVIPFCG